MRPVSGSAEKTTRAEDSALDPECQGIREKMKSRGITQRHRGTEAQRHREPLPGRPGGSNVSHLT
ncbi:MAG: hypothetical protein AVDCRST_MAG68-5618 [uncultured Gemmatimonadetes bacterium]|uniref:Uncharacterized protein n=1 Tax=uncultured Gemmatimonadota bacterium TaxID=203437 RepID=A0A6J4MY42_9BACT|nr:MAG: hypothetical protein AVDCRST_MAG68-5618 [uncultured Gemmatimonadota bacterium]